MKPSYYNLVFKNKNDSYLVYNSLSDSLVEIDEEVKRVIEGELPFDSLPENYKSILKENGLIIESDKDELKEVQVKFDRFKYDTRNLLFTILPTYDCNLSCSYCYEKSLADQSSIDVEKAKLIIIFITDRIIENHSTGLSLFFFGGEPLLFSEAIFNLAHVLKEWCRANVVFFELGLVTNGTLLTSDIIYQLKEFEKVFVQVTLDGPEHVHNQRRAYKDGQKETFKDIIEGIHRCREANFRTKIRVNVDKENYPSLPQLMDELRERGLQGITLSFAPLTPLTKACALYGSYLEEKRVRSAIASLWEQSLEMGFRLDIAPKATPVYCGGLTAAAYIIDPSLNIYKCYGSLGQMEHCVGYIDKEKGFVKRNTYYEILARNPFLFKRKVCLQCKLLPACGGGCALGAYNRFKTYHEGCCDIYSKLIEKRLKLVIKYPDQIDRH